MFDTLDHVILAVRDLHAATRDYATLFGRRPAWRGEHPGQGSANTLFRLGNTYLELLAPEGPGHTASLLRQRLDAVGEGPIGLALGTADADACHATLTERGLSPAEVEPGMGRDSDSGVYRRWRRVPLPLEHTRGVLLFGIEHLSPADMLPESTAVDAEASCISGIDHAVVQTADPEAAIQLYGDGLGLRLALDKSFPQWGMRLMFFRVGGVTVEIAHPLENASALGDTDRLWGMTWRVPDADAAHARLSAAGIEVSEVRKGRKPGTRVLTVKSGTCGVPTLLIEPDTA
ncbi:MAG: VOC family protein [Myxococcota bacterium]